MAEYPIDFATTLVDLVYKVPDEYSNMLALESYETKIYFKELKDHISPISKALIARGLKKGDRVAIWAPNSIDWILCALAIHCAGGIMVPINTRMKGAEAAHVVVESGANIVFSCGKFLKSDYPQMLSQALYNNVPEICLLNKEVSDFDSAIPWASFLNDGSQVDDEDLNFRINSVEAVDPSDILFTSGTTGKPKGVICTHGATVQAFTIYGRDAGFLPGDRYLIVNPFFHAFGYKAGWVSALLSGCTIIPEAVFDAKRILSRIEVDKISILPGPPTLYTSLLADPLATSADLSSLRIAVTGSSSVSPTLVRRMREELGIKNVMTAYGLTECGGLATMCSPSDSPETVANTSGKPIAGTELAIVSVDSPNRQSLPAGETGEICLRGFHVMQGYWQNESATAEAIDDDGWLHTGDLGHLDDQGNLVITGRLKDMFISGGFNCYPAEIEAILQTHPQIHDVAVVGVPDERMGELGCAFVILKPVTEGSDSAEIDEAALIQWSRLNMANYKVPRYFRFVSSFPLNASNKVLKHELISQFSH